MQILLIIAGILALFLLLRWLKQQPRAKRIRYYLAFAAVVLIGLAATGRLHWLFAAGAAALPVIFKFISFLRFTPLFISLFHKIKFGKQGYASFNSRFIRLEMNPSTGTLDGTILQGAFKGRRLTSLNKEETQTLLELLKKEDPKAAYFLGAFFAARSGTAHTAHGAASSGHLTRKDAYQVLGLQEGAARDEIVAAHRKLIQKLHPDRGGSPYLAKVINEAKQLLLED